MILPFTLPYRVAIRRRASLRSVIPPRRWGPGRHSVAGATSSREFHVCAGLTPPPGRVQVKMLTRCRRSGRASGPPNANECVWEPLSHVPTASGWPRGSWARWGVVIRPLDVPVGPRQQETSLRDPRTGAGPHLPAADDSRADPAAGSRCVRPPRPVRPPRGFPWRCDDRGQDGQPARPDPPRPELP
jgi:hypothetical protein